MRTTHKLHLTRLRTFSLLSVLVVLAGLFFAIAPVRQVAAARTSLGLNPAIAKFISYAPLPVRRALVEQLGTVPTSKLAKSVDAASIEAALLTAAPMTVNGYTLSCAPDPVGAGATVTCTATINNADGVGTGELDFNVTALPAGASMLNIAATSTVPAGNQAFMPCGNPNPDNDPVGVPGCDSTGFPGTITQVVITFSFSTPNSTVCGPTTVTGVLSGAGAVLNAGNTQSATVNINHSVDLSSTIAATIIQGDAANAPFNQAVGANTNVVAGPGIVQYSVTANNGGPSQAAAGDVLLTVPGIAALLADPNVSVINVNGGATFGGGCTAALLGGAGCPNVLPFGPGPSAPVTFQVTIGSAIAGGTTLNLSATASANTNNGGANCVVDPVPGNNTSAVVTVTIANSHDLTVSKTATPGSTFAGGLLQYDVTTANLGIFSQTGGNPNASSNAFGFIVTDLLDVTPSPDRGISQLISITPAANFACTPAPGSLPFAGANAPNQIICTFTGAAGLAPGAGAIPVFTAIVKTGANFDPTDVIPDEVTNNAQVAPAGAGLRFDLNGGGPPLAGNNLASVTTPILVAADLAISKSSRTAPVSQPNQPSNSVIAGGANTFLNTFNPPNEGAGNITYTLQFGNAGPGDARNVIIEDNTPAVSGTFQGIVIGNGQQDFDGDNTYAPVAVTFGVAGDASTFAIDCFQGTGLASNLRCTPGDNTAINPNYVRGVMPRRFSAAIAYRIAVNSDATPGNVVVNNARISSNVDGLAPATPDPNSANNTAVPPQNVIVGYADVAIGVGNKTTSNATPVAGGAAFNYQIRITNNGPSNAKNVVMTDPLPQSINFISVSVPAGPAGLGFSCTGPNQNTNGTVTCTSADMPPGNVTVTIVAQVAGATAAGVRTNTAQVSSSTPEPNGGAGNETGSVQQNIVNDASLTVAKTGPANVNAGDNITYTMTISNTGNSTATGVTLTDPLPPFTSFVSATATGGLSGQCSYNQGTNILTCGPGQIPGGQQALITLTLKVAANAPVGNLDNTVTLATAIGAITGANPFTFTTVVNHQADLQITKDDSPDAVNPNGQITYTIKVKNLGPSDAAAGEVRVDEPVFPPTGTTLQGVITANGFACTGTTAFPCTSNASIPAGATATIQYTVVVDPNFNNGNPGGAIANTATVTAVGANIADPNANNNQANTSTPVGPNADLQIGKVAATAAGLLLNAPVRAGGPFAGAIATAPGAIDYTLTYRNNGPGTAVNTVITDVIPANTLLVPGTLTVTPNAGAAPTCTVVANPGTGNQVRCTAATLNIGDNGTVTFRVRVPADVPKSTVIKNQATITSDTPDPNTSSNASNETQNVVDTAADLSITKADAPDPVTAGNNVTYTLVVTNNATPASGSDAQSVTVTDTLPSQVTFVSATSTNTDFNCNQSGGVVTCTAPKLAVGASTTITIVAQVKANTPNGTVLNNTATVSSATTDPANANNTATATTTVNTDANVTITKTDNPDPVVAGTNLTYAVTVHNLGPSDAQNTILTDTLPAGVTFISAVGTGVFSAANSCTQAAGTVVCTANPAPGPTQNVLPAGASATVTIVVKVLPNVPANPLPHTPDNPAGLLNTATVTWVDSNAGTPNTATATTRTTVRHESDMAIKKEAPDYVTAGTRMDYRLIISNKGPSDVLGDATPGSIMVRDVLPAGTTLSNVANNPFIAPGGPGGFTCTYNAGTNTVVCLNAAGAAGNFFAGANLEIIIKVDVASNLANGSNINNCATVTLRDTAGGSNPATPEIDPLGGGQHNDANVITLAASGNNEACDATVVQTSADLGIAKTAAPVVDPDGAGPLPAVALPPANSPTGSVAAGGYITYTVPFGNAGPSDAVNVRITDNVPGNTALVLPTTNPFTITANTVPPTTAINLTCTVTGNPGTAQITCVPADNTAVDPTYVAGVLPSGYRGTLTFTVKVNESVTGGTIVGNAANITSAPQGNAPATGDPNPGNNTTLTTSNLVVANSQLGITKTVLNATFAAVPPAPANAFQPGTLVTYRVIVSNGGPSDVSNLRLIDTIPANAKYVAINQVAIAPNVLGVGDPGINFAATFTCAPPTGVLDQVTGNGGQVQCTAPLMSANVPNNRAAFEVTVFIDPSTKADVSNVATVNATINNFNTSTTASATQTNPVGPTSDIVLNKTHTNTSADGLSVVAGTEFEYTITVTNNGPSTAAMPRLVDIIPQFQTIVAKAGVVPAVADVTLPTGWTCTPANLIGYGNGATLTCDGPSLPPNKKQNGDPNPAGTIVFKFRVKQDPLTPQPTPTFYDNCVTFQSMSFDPTRTGDTPTPPATPPDTTLDANGRFDNAQVCDRVNVSFVSPLAGTKVDTPDPVIAGNNLTYTITGAPAGPSAALNFTIEDALPQGTVFIAAVASAGAELTTPAVNANGTVKAVWNAAFGTPGGLTPVGTVRTLTITVRVCPDFQQIRNLADAGMCVPNLTNTALIYSATPPNLVGNPVQASATTTVQAQSDLSITKTGPASANPSTPGNDSIVTYTLTVANAGPSNANNVVVTDVLPKGFTLVGAPVAVANPANSGALTGVTFSQTTVDGITTVQVNLGVLGAANQCATPRATGAVITIRARVPNKHPNITVTNVATVTSSNCLAEPGTLATQSNPYSGFAAIIVPGTGMLANNRAFFDTIVGPPPSDPGPGSVPGYVATAEVSDQKAGSVLFFPIYTSDAANPNTQNTRISLTNTSNVERATVHLFVVDGSSCSVLDAFLCLTPNQTTTFLASDFDPGATGYIMAVAVDGNTGLPMAFNCLIGDEFVKFTSGHQANLGAEAIAASMMFPAGVNASVTSATLRFDGMNYNRLPRQLALDSIGSRADQNNTLLIVNAVGGNFLQSAATISSLFGFLYDDAETAYSFTQNVSTCQFRTTLSNNFPRIFNGFNNVIPAGRTGWMKFSSNVDRGIFGVAINQNPNAAANSGAFNQGHNLHKLTLTDATTITVPVIAPACL